MFNPGCSVTQSCPTLCDPLNCRMPGFPVLQHLLELAQTHVHWVSDAIQPPHPLSLPLFLPWIFLSPGAFSNESALHIRWPKYWSFSISPSSEYSGLISFRIDWLDLLVSKGLSKVFTRTTICSLALGLLYGFIVQLSHPYMTTRKTVALTIQTFVGKVMSLLFNMPFRFVTAFHPRSKCILILWLQSSSSVILEPKKIKSVTISTYPSSICMKWWDWMPWP